MCVCVGGGGVNKITFNMNLFTNGEEHSPKVKILARCIDGLES